MNRNIDGMTPDELNAYIAEMEAKRARLLAQRQAATTPEPAPVVTEAATYKVTARQRKRLAAFDDLTDGDQVDSLRAMWG